MLRSFCSSTVLVLSVLPLATQARYLGPSIINEQTQVSQILAKPIDGQPVQLHGKLLRQTSKSHYIFSDGTADIVVEIDADDFPRDPIDEHTTVKIAGEVDTGLKRPPRIEVETLSISEQSAQ